MELQQYLRIFRRYWRSAVATFLLGIVLAAGFTLLQSPTYTSAASIFLTVESGGTAGELSQGATYTERQVASYVNVASTELVLGPVIEELGLDMTQRQLANSLSVTSPAATSIIDVAAQHGDPQQAAAIANAVAQSLLSAVDVLSPPGPDGTRLVSAQVIDSALVPTSPTAPRPVMNLALGGLLGILLGLGQAVLRSVLDTRLRTMEDVESLTEAPVLASIGRIDTSADRASERTGQQWANAEAYRRLRTNVGFVGLGGERRSSMVVTSSLAGEGKTETVTNLARVLAHAGESVLLVDADLRRPQLANRMRLDSELGLSDVLTGRGTLQDLVIDVAPGYLAVLPAGTVPPNPSELLGSEAMAHLLATVERQYDYVLFDAPPLLPVTDAVVLSAQTGGAIVVARSGKVRRPQLDAALELLEAGDVTVLGMVLNDVPVTKDNAYGDYYSSHTPESAAAQQDGARAGRRAKTPAAGR
ncbi:polysaccharide biosynthesis tyrosine autokinase [Tessaracoccus rhinocerotis]|uniref:non-specific protein-tyrosine kinase n=1 Tax=Tessaracoccus rhinocerotis TaxID=1689449 RepID=A0A553JWC3_9ACTN|nr:polysaccharide biosynthesis tyrosine autokinase [Tessaracoccus rhinocerotis]TRY16742.1 polysaccharide biosynthesis tyrosine autokinase [Tessaracoccus rhinocerotis]